jgi:serine/threonine-protein kinase
VYVSGGTLSQRTVAFVDRTGVSQSPALPPKSYAHPRVSPNGDKVSFWIQQLRCDIDVYDILRGTLTRLPSEGDNHVPIWSPDGQRITYLLNKPGGSEFFSIPASGIGSGESLTDRTINLSGLVPMSSSADGNELAFANRGDIWLLPRSGAPRPFVNSRFTETTPAFSPDGHWLAYSSDESGRFEVYVQSVSGSGEKYRISIDGGTEPVWARSGRELYFRNGEQLMVVEVSSKSTFGTIRPRLLFGGTFARGEGFTNYDVFPDGKRFVMLNTGEQERAATEITVMLNWFEELKARVPTK